MTQPLKPASPYTRDQVRQNHVAALMTLELVPPASRDHRSAAARVSNPCSRTSRRSKPSTSTSRHSRHAWTRHQSSQTQILWSAGSTATRHAHGRTLHRITTLSATDCLVADPSRSTQRMPYRAPDIHNNDVGGPGSTLLLSIWGVTHTSRGTLALNVHIHGSHLSAPSLADVGLTA